MRDQTSKQFARIAELLDGGDWACSFGQCGTLSHICTELADLLAALSDNGDQRLADKASCVAREARHNLEGATRHWGELAHELRHSTMSHDLAARRRTVPVHESDDAVKLMQ